MYIYLTVKHSGDTRACHQQPGGGGETGNDVAVLIYPPISIYVSLYLSLYIDTSIHLSSSIYRSIHLLISVYLHIDLFI